MPSEHSAAANGQPEVSVILPSFNEGDNLRRVVSEIDAKYELVIVEGARYRRTEQVVRQVRPDAVIIEQTRYGKGNALACGFVAAHGHILVTVDGDESADPQEIERFVQAVRDGADLAKGTRSRGGGSDDLTWLRRSGNIGLTLIANVLFRQRFSDLCYGFNALSRHCAAQLGLPDPQPEGGPLQYGDGFEIEAIISCRAARLGLTIVEVPSHEHQRGRGRSNLHVWRDGWRVLHAILTERTRALVSSQPSRASQP